MLLKFGQLVTFPLIGLLFFASQSLSAETDDGNRLVVFGDSLSHIGSSQDHPTHDGWRGRASNGPIWVDYVSRHLRAQVRDYAQPGATSSNTLVPTSVPSVLDQIDRAYPQGRPVNIHRERRSTFAIFIGTNDYYRTVLRSGTVDENLIRGSVNSVINAINILRLRARAQKFLIINLPPLDLKPIARERTHRVRRALAISVAKHNALLAKRLSEYQQQHSDLRIARYNIHDFLTKLIREPRQHGFSHSQVACIRDEQPRCSNPNTYVFWDKIHYTTRTHHLIAKDIIPKLPSS